LTFEYWECKAYNRKYIAKVGKNGKTFGGNGEGEKKIKKRWKI